MPKVKIGHVSKGRFCIHEENQRIPLSPPHRIEATSDLRINQRLGLSQSESKFHCCFLTQALYELWVSETLLLKWDLASAFK